MNTNPYREAAPKPVRKSQRQTEVPFPFFYVGQALVQMACTLRIIQGLFPPENPRLERWTALLAALGAVMVVTVLVQGVRRLWRG